MGSPTIFSGRYTKLLTNKSILNSDGSLLQYDGAKNYIPYAQFEQNVTTGWSLFNTTLTSGLPTGTVGAGAASLALSTTSTNPIAGAYSLQVAAGTAWTAGQGVISSAFTVDRADLGKVLTFKLYYEAASGGANANWSGVLGSQTLAVYLYDVTAAAWVQPAGFLGMNQNSGAGYVTGTFQTSVTSGQQYQLAIIALQATTLPLTLTLDQVSVGPQTAPIGPVVTDWVSYTPTVTAASGTVTNATHTGKWRRVGDNIEVKVTTTFSAASSAFSNIYYSLPSGLSIDTTKLTDTNETNIGFARCLDNATLMYSIGSAVYLNPTTFRPTYPSSLGATSPVQASNVTNAAPFTFGASDTIVTEIAVPIQGWSSNVQMSNDTDTRVISATAYVSAATVSLPSAVETRINFNTIDSDSNAAITTGASWVYTAPVSGVYEFAVNVTVDSVNAAQELSFYKNGVQSGYQAMTATSGYNTNSLTRQINMIAGDTFYATIRQSNAAARNIIGGAGRITSISIKRLSGPSVIAATETVACTATQNTGQSISNNTITTIVYNAKLYDTHNMVNTSTGAITIPVSGKYRVSAKALWSAFSWSTGQTSTILLQKNASGTLVLGRVDELETSAALTRFANLSGSCTISCNAGDILTIAIDHTTGATRTLHNDATHIYVSIERVGN